MRDKTVLRDETFGKELVLVEDNVYRVVWLDDNGDVDMNEFDDQKQATEFYESLN